MSEEQKNEVKKAENQENKVQNPEIPPEKNKKIKFMNLKELETAIEKTKKHQGGLYSRYAFELIKRRDFLKNNQK